MRKSLDPNTRRCSRVNEREYSDAETLTYKVNGIVRQLSNEFGPRVTQLAINQVLGGLDERAVDNYEAYDLCVSEVKDRFRELSSEFGRIAVRDAFENILSNMLESRKNTNRKKVNEMGRLSTIHTSGADRRAAGAERRTAAINRRSINVTVDDVSRIYDEVLEQFAHIQYEYASAFCTEVNEDAQNKIIVAVETANEHLQKNGIKKLVNMCDESGVSFNAYWGLGYPQIFAGKPVGGWSSDDSKGSSQEVADAINDCISRNEPVYFFYPARDPHQFFEFENYEPICHPGIWDKTFDIKSRKGLGATLVGGSSKAGAPKGFIVAVLNNKSDWHIVKPEENESSALATTDDLFDCLDQDEVFANWLMTSEYDPMFDEESGEYLESVKSKYRVDNSITNFNSKGNTGMFNKEQKVNHKKVYEGFYTDEEREARGIHPQDGGGICNICGEDVAGGDYYADDLDSTREIILEYLCEEFGMRWNYSAEYEVQRMFGWDDDTWEESIEEIYGYLPDGSDYLCHDCMHQACKEAVHQWHLDYFDDEE